VRIGGVRLKTDDRRMIGHEAGARERRHQRDCNRRLAHLHATCQLTPAQRSASCAISRSASAARLCPVSSLADQRAAKRVINAPDDTRGRQTPRSAGPRRAANRSRYGTASDGEISIATVLPPTSARRWPWSSDHAAYGRLTRESVERRKLDAMRDRDRTPRVRAPWPSAALVGGKTVAMEISPSDAVHTSTGCRTAWSS